MELVNEVLHKYCESHSKVFNEDVLLEIDRFTNLNVLMPQMLSGYLQGQYLAMMSKMIQPKNILEIGTFTGYSAVCLAQGLVNDGHLYTLEVNEELKIPVTDFFKKAGLENKISMNIGNALELIDGIDVSFDLVFIDADKTNYPLYYEKCLPKLRQGGIMLIDNVLWSGKVCEAPIKDKKTKAIHELNQKIQNDDRVENILLPLRDGMMWVRKLID
jgi:predicted O-methyltransferase YrrM